MEDEMSRDRPRTVNTIELDEVRKFDRRLLVAARALARMSQAEFARLAGIHINALQRIESGGDMRRSTFNKLLATFAAQGVEFLREEEGSWCGVRFGATYVPGGIPPTT